MHIRIKTLLVLASVLAKPFATGHVDRPSIRGLGGTATIAAQTSSQVPSYGSVVPCAIPLPWRIAEIDPRFGLDESGARDALRRAIALWERALDRQLFSVDGVHGFPVRFEFDDRQALLRVRQSLQADLRAAGERIEARRSELRGVRTHLERARAEYQERLETYERRITEHNAEVRSWNERGGAPPAVQAELRRRSELLEAERRSLERQREDLSRIQRSLQTESEQLNRQIRELNRQSETLGRDDSVTAAEAGRYNESVRRREDAVVSVERTIRVFRFEDEEQLVLLLAHELGHALGLGHSSHEGSVMREVMETGGESPPLRELLPADIRMLRERCPGL